MEPEDDHVPEHDAREEDEIDPGIGLLDDDDEDVAEPPLSFWESLIEIAGGLIALFLVSVGVLLLYVVGGIFLGVLTWAAPAVLVISAVIILGRLLSRRE